MRRVGVEELGHLPFVRHQLDPTLVESAWVAGGAAVVTGLREVADGPVRVVTGFGPGEPLAALLDGVAEQVVPPDRVMVTGPVELVPAAWPLTDVRQWHWMLSTRRLPRTGSGAVEEVTDDDEIAALLAVAAPGSHARPGTPGITRWLGIRDGRRLVAVGAVLSQPDGTGHVRAVSVHPAARGRGLGRALSVALTRDAMEGSGVSSLGVYVDNAPALRLYRDLGYEVVHTFTSGPVRASSITSAAAPSR